MLHCGKFYLDFYNINLQNFTLVTAGELIVNGGRIWARERREFWFIVLCNNPGLHEIQWKVDFRMTRLPLNILCTLYDLLSQRQMHDSEKQFQQRKGQLLPCGGWQQETATILLKKIAVAKLTATETKLQTNFANVLERGVLTSWHFRKLRGNSRAYQIRAIQ